MENGARIFSGPDSDPRRYQILCQALILAYGLAYLELGGYAPLFLAYLLAALATQCLCLWLLRSRLRRRVASGLASRPEAAPALPPYDFKSALITALSLALLLRVESPALAALAAGLAVASKFLIRLDGKHIFNPSLFGIVVMLALGEVLRWGAWVSPGQWGRGGLLLGGVLLGGGMVLYRALRADISLAFLGSYAGLILARALYLGDPLAIAWHQLSNGALLIFAFFMISDPRSTPDRRSARLLFAAGVAAFAVYLQFVPYNTNALFWSLAACSLATPLLDRWLPAARFVWRPTSSAPEQTHETRTIANLGRRPYHAQPAGGGL